MNKKTIVTLYQDKIVCEYAGTDGVNKCVLNGPELKEKFTYICTRIFESFMFDPHGEVVFRVVEEIDNDVR